MTERHNSKEAGRELDALIAEKLMGWTDVQLNAYVNYKPGRDACGTHPDRIGGWDGFGRGAIPHYSTTIVAAWQVVEMMERARRVVVVKADGLRDGEQNPRYTVLVDNMPRVDANTAPLAICRAALSASDPSGD